MISADEALRRRMKEMRQIIIEILDEIDDLRQKVRRLEAIDKLRRGDQ